MQFTRYAAVLVILALSGTVSCGAAGDESESAAATPADSMRSSAGGMQGMEGMGMEGMAGMGTMNMTIEQELEARMRGMRSATPDSLVAMLPMHRQMVGNMLAKMNREMNEMKMSGDAAWDATVDSLRSDLTRMPQMNGAQLHEFMPQHQERVSRIINMHGAMVSTNGGADSAQTGTE